jgi:hypothetical protein
MEALQRLWDYCMDNKKQSIIFIVAVVLLFSVLGYASVIVLFKILGALFSLVWFYVQNFYITVPITLLGVWWYKKRQE